MQNKDSNLYDKSEEELVSFNIRTIPRSLRNRFKAWCSEHGVTMQDAVVKLVKKTVDNEVKIL